MYKPKVLLVDGDTSFRANFADYLINRNKYTIFQASNGIEALNYVKSQNLDIIITELKMPESDGLELLESCHESFPDIPVIFLTSHGTVQSVRDALNSGAQDFLEKPVTFDNVEQHISEVLSKNIDKNSQESVDNKEYVPSRVGDFIVGEHSLMNKMYKLVQRIAPTDSTVLIFGESGTGKELVARSIHDLSKRHSGPLVPVNCAAIPDTLMESELFGHVKGAFTGAMKARIGRFQLADGGTIFLDEIGEMPLNLQVKLLRVLQEKTVCPVGGSHIHKVDFRVVAATNKDLEKAVEDGEFREDLFYRLNVLPINICSLRERKSDIPRLANFFLDKFNQSKECSVSHIDSEAMQMLLDYSWPGNVRELENIIERMVILSGEGEISKDDIPAKISKVECDNLLLEMIPDEGLDFNQVINDYETQLIIQALERTNGNKNKAAQLLNLNRTTLVEKIKKKGIEYN